MEALEKVFGVDKVRKELKKFDDGTYSSMSQQENKENKETWNGQAYENVAPGDRKFVTEPNAEMKKWGNTVKIMKVFAPKKIVIGAVYVPYDENDPETVDTHGHACLAEDIEKAAYKFMEDMNLKNIDQQHNFTPGYGFVVESYLAKSGDPMFKEGTWVMGVKITNDEVWGKIEKGEITGFSLAGSARLEDPS